MALMVCKKIFAILQDKLCKPLQMSPVISPVQYVK